MPLASQGSVFTNKFEIVSGLFPGCFRVVSGSFPGCFRISVCFQIVSKFISKRSASNPESIYRIKSAYINGLLDGRLYYYLKAWGENQSFADSIYADRVDYMTPKETIRQIDRFYQDPLMDYVPVISALIIVHMQAEQAPKRIVDQYIYQTKLWINNLILDMEEAGMRNLLKDKQNKQQR